MGIAAKNPYENDDELEGQEARAVDGPREVELTTIDHVGIAVADLDDALDHYRRVFGATVDFRERFDEDGVEVAAMLGATEAACRQWVAQAKAAIAQRKPRYTADPAQVQRAVMAFMTACASGDIQAAMTVLAPAATAFAIPSIT